MLSLLLEWLPSDVTKKFIVYVWKNLTGQASQLEMRLFIYQFISKHHFWKKTPITTWSVCWKFVEIYWFFDVYSGKADWQFCTVLRKSMNPIQNHKCGKAVAEMLF